MDTGIRRKMLLYADIHERTMTMPVTTSDNNEMPKKLNRLNCPKCRIELNEIDYKGIRIDKCSRCGGIWLDAGELDEISSLETSSLTRLFFVVKE